jgi:uncharacterized protein (TIGR00106 family)
MNLPEKEGDTVIIAELSIFPTSEGPSVSRFVREAIRVIEASGLRSVTGGMSTTIEAPDMAALFRVVQQAHEAVLRQGARRVHIDLHVDHRLDKEATIASKLGAVGKP